MSVIELVHFPRKAHLLKGHRTVALLNELLKGEQGLKLGLFKGLNRSCTDVTDSSSYKGAITVVAHQKQSCTTLKV